LSYTTLKKIFQNLPTLLILILKKRMSFYLN